MNPDIKAARAYFMSLQEELCAALEAMDAAAAFSREEFPEPDGALARPRVLQGGQRIEKAAVQFTHSIGQSLPAAATERNPGLAGSGFQATAISLILHPRNPYAPAAHLNLRFFLVAAKKAAAPALWHFGGGFDLSPCYLFEEDCIHWHRTARQAVGHRYPALKAACDQYFRLPHRDEGRGVGGLFFDDWTEGGFAASLAFVQAVGNAFLPAYRPIFERRADLPYGDRQRQWQLLRRGRYAEFNLALDRGTRYGLQSGRRVESVLASLPPLAAWRYGQQPQEGSPEADILPHLKRPKDWLPPVDNSGDELGTASAETPKGGNSAAANRIKP